MNSRKGAATLYIIVGIMIFLSIMTYIFTSTSNMEVDILTYFKNIKNEYEDYTTEEKKEEIMQKLQHDADAIITQTIETNL